MTLQDRAAAQPLAARGRLFHMARVGWYPLAAVALAILLASIPGYLSPPSLGVFDGVLEVERTPLTAALEVLTYLTSFLATTLSLGFAALLFFTKPADRMALLLAYYLLGHGTLFAGPIEMLHPIWPEASWVNSFILLPLFSGPASMALFALFPDGRFVPRWAAWLIPAGAASALHAIWGMGLAPALLPAAADWAYIAVAVVLWATLLPAAVYVQVYRYRRVSTPEQRQQTKWVLYGVALWFGCMALTTPGWSYALTLPAGTAAPWWLHAGTLVWTASAFCLPVSLTLAVMRYRLFDIDLLINRTLAYAALTACVIGIYALVVGGLGALLHDSGNLAVSLAATGLVAVLFQPLRERLQRAVNRLVYGERDDPLQVLARLGRQLEENVPPQALLAGMVETVRNALRLPYVAIEVVEDGRLRRLAAAGSAPEAALRLPLVHHGETIGRLAVAVRSAGLAFDAVEHALLETVARQAGAAVHAARLAADLQRSRQKLVAAREEERRRLRRDLHDGLGPQLASQTLTLDALERRLRNDPASAPRLIRELKEQAQAAVQDIRRLLYDLRPPALDQLGLVGAIRETAASFHQCKARFDVRTNGAPLPEHLPAAVEVAAFRIAQEALTNVVRHAEARACQVSVWLETERDPAHLNLEVRDNGRGLWRGAGREQGLGLESMRERAEELGGTLEVGPARGGGTLVRARLPLGDA